MNLGSGHWELWRSRWEEPLGVTLGGQNAPNLGVPNSWKDDFQEIVEIETSGDSERHSIGSRMIGGMVAKLGSNCLNGCFLGKTLGFQSLVNMD